MIFARTRQCDLVIKHDYCDGRDAITCTNADNCPKDNMKGIVDKTCMLDSLDVLNLRV